ncbi:MAG: transcription antitermination factor NusB [Candidatus Omnitrophota bacterium]|nr:transcription antitermination factor NusB [Candidatus Omnitrophota bacterium]MDZ4241345.1 transcription antitermination factor NusB [Candidatus Omnitrophota bacterium]
MRKRTFSRECVLKILYQKEVTARPLPAAAEKFWENFEEELSPDIREFTDFLVAGIEANWEAIDEKISKYATNWQLKRMAIIDRNVLRIGVFELHFAPNIPPKVTINEAVELAKKYGDLDSSKFVNGILDKIHKTEIATDTTKKSSQAK